MRRRLLAVVLGSIALNAALGIAALVIPHFGGPEVRVLATSACVTGAGVLVLACLPAWERRRLGPVPPLAMGLGVLGFALAVGGIWWGGDSDAYGRALGTVLVCAVLLTLICLTALVRLAPRYLWVQHLAMGAAGVLAVLFVIAIWGEVDDGWYPRAAGVVAVLLAASVVALPVLHRASRGWQQPASLVRFCPLCGAAAGPGAAAARELACAACGARVAVRVVAGPAPATPAPGAGPQLP